MALTNDSVLVTPGSGATIATHLANSKEHQAMVIADSGGHIIGTRDAYRLIVPSSAVGASQVHLDLFNGTGSGNTLRIVQARAFPLLDVAIVGVVGLQLYLTRTTSVGTGGTPAVLENPTLATPGLNKFDPASPALNGNITARSRPTAGAAAGVILGHTGFFTEETNAGSAVAAALGGDFLRDSGYDFPIPENTGIRVVQGTVASLGTLMFVIDFVLA